MFMLIRLFVVILQNLYHRKNVFVYMHMVETQICNTLVPFRLRFDKTRQLTNLYFRSSTI
jgi:hypothetical protein